MLRDSFLCASMLQCSISGIPNKGDKVRSGCLTLIFSGAHNWAELLPHPCILGSPQQRRQNQKWPPHPCLLGGPKVGRIGTPTFSGVPNKGNKMRSGCLTPTFSGAHKWAELLRRPYILGGAQKWGSDQKWLPHPCLLGGPQVGRIATPPLHSRGSPTKGTKSKMATLGARTKLWMCSLKEHHQEIFSKNRVLA